MAKKKSMTPAQRYLTYELAVEPSDLSGSTPVYRVTTMYLDIARDLSLLNRRLYRQGMDYHIKSITFMSRNTPTGSATASVVPCTWTVMNAYRRGRAAWNAANKDAMKNVNSSIVGKWADFRIDPVNGIQSTAYLTPEDAAGNAYPAGTFDWEKAKFEHHADDANGANIHLLGDHLQSGNNYASVGLVKSYFESRVRTRPEDPILDGDISDDYITTLMDSDEVQSRRIQNIEAFGDNPPYDHDNAVGELIMPDFHTVKTRAFSDGNCVLGSFNSFMGIVRLDVTSDATGVAADLMKVVVEVAAGPYKGIKAVEC